MPCYSDRMYSFAIVSDCAFAYSESGYLGGDQAGLLLTFYAVLEQFCSCYQI